MLKAKGLDVAALFDEAGLETVALSDPDSRFPTEKVSLLWELAVARSGNPTIGLAKSNIVRPASFDVVAYTMMSSPHLLGILESLNRYVGIVSDAASIVILEDDEGYRMILELFGGGRPVPRQRFEFDLITILSFCRWVTNRDLRPLALEHTKMLSNAPCASMRRRMPCCSPGPMCSLPCRQRIRYSPRCISGSPPNVSSDWIISRPAAEPAPQSFAVCRRANRGAPK